MQFSQPTSLLLLHPLNLGSGRYRGNTLHLHCRESEQSDNASFAFLLSRIDVGSKIRQTSQTAQTTA